MKFLVTIDFNDDMWKAETDWTADKLRECVAKLATHGITGLRWVEHGRLDDGLYDPGAGFDRDGVASRLCKTMPDPRQVMIDAAHEHGMEIVQVLKPWDMAFDGSPSLFFPHGYGPQPPVGLPRVGGEGGGAIRWIREHPDKLVRLHPSLLEPDKPRQPIRTLRFWHESGELAEAPTLEIYVSSDNHTYRKYDGPMRIVQDVRKRRPPMYALHRNRCWVRKVITPVLN